MNWGDFIAAVAILLVVEGIMPFLSPARSRRVFEQMSRLGDRDLRIAGLVSMLAGLGLLFYVRN